MINVSHTITSSQCQLNPKWNKTKSRHSPITKDVRWIDGYELHYAERKNRDQKIAWECIWYVRGLLLFQFGFQHNLMTKLWLLYEYLYISLSPWNMIGNALCMYKVPQNKHKINTYMEYACRTYYYCKK